MSTRATDMAAPATLARIAGFLYLIIIVCAGFSEGVVRGNLHVPGNALTTAQNIAASETLFRLGFVADLVAFLSDAAVAVLLYALLRPVSQIVALLSMAFRLLAHPAIAATNLLNHFAAVLLLDGGGSLGAFSTAQREELALFALDLHGYGYLVAGAFFGVHCALLGWLLYRSALFPRVLGFLMAAAAVGYLAESFVFFLTPSYGALATSLVVVTASVGEITLCLYLVIRGVRRPVSSGPGSVAPEGRA